MTTIRVKRHIDSETVHLPELRPLIGKEVEIIVVEQNGGEMTIAEEQACYPLRGSVLRDDEPFETVGEGDWEALH